MKQVIVVRRELKMPKGKIAAQVAHASLGAVLSLTYDHTLMHNGRTLEKQKVLPLTPAIAAWFNGPFTKVVLQVETEAELLALRDLAKNAGLPHCLIRDSGKTVFHNVVTTTCLAIGPGDISKIDKITGTLKLLN